MVVCMKTESFQSGYVQGGSDGMPILGDFITKYSKHAAALGVPADDLYQALVDTAENTVCPCLRVFLSVLDFQPSNSHRIGTKVSLFNIFYYQRD